MDNSTYHVFDTNAKMADFLRRSKGYLIAYFLTTDDEWPFELNKSAFIRDLQNTPDYCDYIVLAESKGGFYIETKATTFSLKDVNVVHHVDSNKEDTNEAG